MRIRLPFDYHGRCNDVAKRRFWSNNAADPNGKNAVVETAEAAGQCEDEGFQAANVRRHEAPAVYYCSKQIRCISHDQLKKEIIL